MSSIQCGEPPSVCWAFACGANAAAAKASESAADSARAGDTSRSWRSMSLALADVVVVRVDERRLRALHVAQVRAARRKRVGTHRGWCVADRAEDHARVVQAEEAHHVVLVDTVAGNADAADQHVAA